MREKGLMWYYLRTFLKPLDVFNQLLEDRRYYKFGFGFILIPIVGYTLLYIFLTIGNGAPSVFTPWLNIPKDIYYSVNRFLLAPSMLMSWFVAASVMQVSSRYFNGKGTFEQTLSVMALCISASMAAALMHDLPMSFLSAIGVINAREHEIAMNSPTIWRTLLWISYSLYFVLFIILFQRCVLSVHKLSKSLSFFIGSMSFAVFQTVFVIFNR